MAHVRTIHEVILNGETVIPAGTHVEDMSKALVDELQPIGAIEVLTVKEAAKAAEAEVKLKDIKG